MLLVKEDVTAAHLVDTTERVLHDTHQRTVSLRGDDVEGNHAEIDDF